jgi:hypothetical protein
MSFNSRPDVEPERCCKEDTRTQHEAVLNAAEAACRREVQSNQPARNAKHRQGGHEDCKRDLESQVRMSITHATIGVCFRLPARSSPPARSGDPDSILPIEGWNPSLPAPHLESTLKSHVTWVAPATTDPCRPPSECSVLGSRWAHRGHHHAHHGPNTERICPVRM